MSKFDQIPLRNFLYPEILYCETEEQFKKFSRYGTDSHGEWEGPRTYAHFSWASFGKEYGFDPRMVQITRHLTVPEQEYMDFSMEIYESIGDRLEGYDWDA